MSKKTRPDSETFGVILICDSDFAKVKKINNYFLNI